MTALRPLCAVKGHMHLIAPGAFLYRGFFDVAAQERLARDIAAIIARAPLFTPRMPGVGNPFSVRMTNCGPLGWVSDKEKGYRYEPRHPVTGEPWPPMPEILIEAWTRLADYPKPPQACLVNVYDETARMGLHQDRDEAELSAPIVSISLGADCRFRLGGPKRSGKTQSFVLSSGDAFVFGGPARLFFHGVDKILPMMAPALSPTMLSGGARINLTLRRVS
jgi:alkylated DNA repair protein (DNA oxidative demethylase)